MWGFHNFYSKTYLGQFLGLDWLELLRLFWNFPLIGIWVHGGFGEIFGGKLRHYLLTYYRFHFKIPFSPLRNARPEIFLTASRVASHRTFFPRKFFKTPFILFLQTMGHLFQFLVSLKN